MFPEVFLKTFSRGSIMKSTSPIKILMTLICLLGILNLSGGCISKDEPSSVNQSVSIVAVSRQQEDGIIQISGMTDLPAGSGVMYEVLPDNILTRKKTVEDVDGISGRTAASKGEGLTPWSITINMTVWRPGKYIVNAWPEGSDPRYGDRKMFFIPLNDTVSNGLGKDSATGEIILYAITPSEPSSLPVSITPKPTPDTA
jgi:hypothetical protein